MTPDMTYCGQARSGSEALNRIGIVSPDVAVVDLSLNDAYGLDLTELLRDTNPDLRVLILSMYDERVFAERAIETGALGYIMKRTPTHQITEGIRSVVQNETYLSPNMTARLLNKIAKGVSDSLEQTLDCLTHRELAVLMMIGEGTTTLEMAERLKLDRKTIETHRRHVKEKLGFGSVSALLHYATQWRHAQGMLLPLANSLP